MVRCRVALAVMLVCWVSGAEANGQAAPVELTVREPAGVDRAAAPVTTTLTVRVP